MASAIEVREKYRGLLLVLLELKKNNQDHSVIGLQEAIMRAIALMDQEDVAWVEKVVGVNAL